MSEWWNLGGLEKKRKKLEKHRRETLSTIRGEQLNFEAMSQRVGRAGDTLDGTLVSDVLNRLKEIERQAREATGIDDLDDLAEDAEQQGQLRAYICPRAEIEQEGYLVIDLMGDWGVPRPVITKLENLLGRKLKNADRDPVAARSALRALFEEQDSWNNYTTDYAETMGRLTRWLFIATIVLVPLSILAFRRPFTFQVGLLLAGAAGSCISVMGKMPLLEVSPSGELEAYGRRILSRVGTGIGASVIGCALLGWGLLPISVQNQTFADLLNACAESPAPSCTTLKTVILLGIPMLFGFTERALTSFEQRVFEPKGRRGRIDD